MALSGWSTEEGTQRYRQHKTACHPDHFRRLQDLWSSSIGFGTYLGDPDEATDRLYAEALETALESGCNLIDTAINYRCQRSERVIGHTLERLIAQGHLQRDEVTVCTKGGYIPFDGVVPRDPERYLIETFLNPGVFEYDDLVAGCHVLRPSYLEQQLATSLQNLRLETVDVYYLHNPEQQLDEILRATFLSRLEGAFALLEEQVRIGRIQWYGTATWNGYRANPEAPNYLSLAEVLEVAQRVGGTSHHFRIVQLPYNLRMPEAFAFKNQRVDGESLTLLEAAERLGVSVVVSASLLQSQLAALPDAVQTFIDGLRTDAQRAIQFVRSTPGVTTALVGMKRRAHVQENLELATHPLLPPEPLTRLLTPATRRSRGDR